MLLRERELANLLSQESSMDSYDFNKKTSQKEDRIRVKNEEMFKTEMRFTKTREEYDMGIPKKCNKL